jgi:hypothetical protein
VRHTPREGHFGTLKIDARKEVGVITEIVLFGLPEGMTREELVRNYRETAPKWRANPDLIRKTYLFDPEKRQGGGVYLWRDIHAARRAHDESWRHSVRELYGSDPTVRYFVTPLVVDNELEHVVEEAHA